jgi:hypothetical protein
MGARFLIAEEEMDLLEIIEEMDCLKGCKISISILI